MKDVRAIVFECVQCGSAVSYPVADWQRVPKSCPNCRDESGGKDFFHQLYDSLKESISRLLQDYDKLPYRVRLELADRAQEPPDASS